MQGDAEIKIVGRLAGDPALAYTPGGQPYTTITVMTSPRYFDRQENKWVDGQSSGWRVTCWSHLAEHVCQSLSKGDPVMVIGTITREKRQDNGEWVDRITADEIGATLRWNDVKVARTERRSQQADPEKARDHDAWATP